ncbi:hypothetical protein EPA93_30510 [Ktedonosporobacter rubrisoli]|uniref:Uncharacterized protein n=1 Tax=Ktedonosporobacter rubrisoli TaxID=2509675 RepID=A0A4V0YZK9_KTERU|nr:hypothetical protein [Ktedonosporobacter rubrisoli]QBD80081.1 hypothetical protein EPA93_30510 [Ktedonosporobacter rubrisoli]
MQQPAIATYRFRLGRTAYIRNAVRCWLLLGTLLISALAAIALSIPLWNSYAHTLTPYLKWQDEIVILLGCIIFIASIGCVLVARLLFALHAGHHKSMVTLEEGRFLTVRDLAAENIASIISALRTAVWCFGTVLVALFPAVLPGWTLHMADPVLAVLTTGLALLLCLGGLVLTVGAIGCIIMGCVGLISFCQKLGAPQRYELVNGTGMRIDRHLLTIICPGSSESVIDLKLLNPEDRSELLTLLRERWLGKSNAWNLSLGEEPESTADDPEYSKALV